MERILPDPAEFQRSAEAFRRDGKRIALVPTMGALHEGHCSLIRIARGLGDVVMTTLFVNPTQFGAGEDFERYPRDLKRDAAAAEASGSDLLFAPQVRAMYPDGYATFVQVEGITDLLEGAVRPGHFRGVATVVVKLLNLAKPHTAVFGQKDAQQVAVIRRAVSDLNLDVAIVVGPTVREPDGLAMSSRNAYLSAAQRREAPVLYRALQLAEGRVRAGERRSAPILEEMRGLIERSTSGRIDYLSVADPLTMQEVSDIPAGRELLVSLAVRFGATRLIDNIRLTGA